MKKKISVRELKSFCEENPPHEVAYYTENQGAPYEPCRLMLHFKNVLIAENPNVVCLKSDKSSVCFDQVLYAELEEIGVESVDLGMALKLYCGSRMAPKPTSSYTLIVS